ncbi:hypothetical protein [Muriicola soli]|uniref:Uncharacterized protein n=1 Tax=Muriicola soli TaxID=2507538 RepID=A0A411E6F3_9FLAO|nr:hypothetical protein [Muriicola soli]QBA63197.1 hypothetical protein EQY75_00670 [Muriicola soli]
MVRYINKGPSASFIAALMVALLYSVFKGDLDLAQRLMGGGISVFGIIGVVLVAILKGQLDKSENDEQRNNIIESLIRVFTKSKKNENGGSEN